MRKITLASFRYKSYSSLERLRYATTNARQLIRLASVGRRPLDASAVFVGRNDDYMANFLSRILATSLWNIQHGIREIVFVEWNPPPTRELLSEKLTAHCPQMRAFVVPAEIHAHLCKNSDLPLLEYHAKNVGLRRANSDWVIATNADIAFGPSALLTMRRGTHAETEAWTAERVDIHWGDRRTRPLTMRDCLRYRRRIPYQLYGTGDFLLAHRDMWDRIGGYDESLVSHRVGCDIRGAAQMIEHGADIKKAGTVLHLAHPTSITEGGHQPHTGLTGGVEGLPYENPSSWGLRDLSTVQISERVWRLE